MADGHAALDAHIKRLRSLPAALTTGAAPEVAVEVQRELASQVSRGVGPDGTPWPLTKDGRRPLEDAARAIRVRALGDVILARLDGHHALHHLGRARGGVRRQILPTAKIPDPVTKAIGTVLERRFKTHMGVR